MEQGLLFAITGGLLSPLDNPTVWNRDCSKTSTVLQMGANGRRMHANIDG
jgi:hypothetical protein